MNGRIKRWVDGRKDTQMTRWTDGWMDERKGGWTDGRKHTRIDIKGRITKKKMDGE